MEHLSKWPTCGGGLARESAHRAAVQLKQEVGTPESIDIVSRRRNLYFRVQAVKIHHVHFRPEL